MKKQNNTSSKVAIELRRKAETKVKKKKDVLPKTKAELLKLVHDFEVHQVELEMMNEELQQSRAEVEKGLEAYTDLYDFAPSAYFTIARNGTILRANLKGSSLLGTDRSKLLNRRIHNYLSKDSYKIFDDLIHKTFQSKTKESCEVTFNKYRVDPTKPAVLDDEGNALLLYTYVEAIVGEDSDEIKLIMLDITERKWAEDQIKYFGRSWQTTFNAIKDSIFLLDPNEIILQANNASLSLFNLSQENIIGKHCYEVVHNTQYPFDGCPLLKSKLSKQKESMLLPINDKWFEVIVDPILDGMNNITGFVHIVSDITERKLAEEKIFEDEIRYRRLHETMFDCYVQVDMSGKIIDFNHSFVEMLGYSKEELFSFTYPEITPHRWFEFEQKIIEEQILTKGYSDIYEKEYIKKDGTVFPVELRTYLLRDSEGNPESMWAIVRDITNRKKAEQALSKSEERYRLISSVASDYVFSSDVIEDGTLKLNWVSGSFEKITGYTFEEYTTQSGWFKSLHPDDIVVDKLDMENLNNNKQVITELRTIAKNGNTVWVRVYAQPVWDNSEKKLIGIYGAVLDITEKKLAEEALKESEEKWRLLVSNSPDFIALHDKDGRFLFLNHYAEGFNEENVIGSSAFDFISEESRDIFKNNFETCINNFTTQKFEFSVYGDNKTFRSYEQYLVPIIRKNKEVNVLAVARDITKRKLAEEELRSKNNLLTAIYESSPFIMIIVDNEGKVISINNAGAKFASREKDELFGLLGGEVFNCLNSFQAPGCGRNKECSTCPIRTRVSHTFATGELILNGEGEMNFLIDGGEVKLNLSITTTLIQRSEGDAVLVFIEDITERKHSETALRKSESRNRTILKTAMDGFWIVDMQGHLLEVNESYAQMSGYSVDELLSMSISDLESKETQIDTANHIKKVIALGEDRFESQHRAKDGKVLYVNVSVQFRQIDGGRLIVFLHDITNQKIIEMSLRESEAYNRMLFEQSTIGLAVSSMDGRLVDLNLAYAKIIGRTIEETLGLTYWDITPQKYSDQELKQLESLENEGHYGPYEKEYIHKDGHFVSVRLQGLIIEQKGEKFIWSSVEDITEKKQSEQRIRENEEIFNQLMQHSPIYIFFKDENIRPIRLSSNYEQMLKMPIEYLIGKNMNELFPSELAKNIVEDDKRILFNGEFVKVDEEFDGRYYSTIKFPIKIEGKSQYLAGFTIDVTENKRAEDALKESEERFHLMFENHNAVMILVDPETGQILDANQSAEKYYGYTIEKLKHLNISDINVMPNEELAIKLSNSTLIPRSHSNFPHKLSSGEIRLVEVHTSPISIKGKTVLFSIIQDITERKKAEQELYESQEKLRALTARLERVKEEERINLSRELHDHLGQNLTGLKMDTAWLAKKIQSDTTVDSEDLIQKTKGMLLLIDELISNVRKISAELRPNVLDYLGLIPAIEWQMEDLKKRTEIDCELKSSIQKIDLGVQINSSIFRIIQEAFTNVIRHSGATKIEVSIAEESDFIKLEILDNGIGINENNISNLHSLGILGMRERTMQFNGKLHLENAEQGGTLLTLIIPKKN